VTAENVADSHGISRDAQDEFALESHRRAQAAMEAGRFDEEVVPIEVKARKGAVEFSVDEHVRRDAAQARLTLSSPARANRAPSTPPVPVDRQQEGVLRVTQAPARLPFQPAECLGDLGVELRRTRLVIAHVGHELSPWRRRGPRIRVSVHLRPYDRVRRRAANYWSQCLCAWRSTGSVGWGAALCA
jgi:hypothetical protein